ncbi:MAG: hypothetical protein KGZ60_04295 [Truepera sp.]|nr:hypothetical protein [Truepera sp.]
MATLRPAKVVISVGANTYGHPARQALESYASVGARIYRTDQQGHVSVVEPALTGTFPAQQAPWARALERLSDLLALF